VGVFSLEAAYHIDLGDRFRNGWELVPFYRYTYENLRLADSLEIDDNLPTGQGQRQFHTFGLALFPTPQVVLESRLSISRSTMRRTRPRGSPAGRGRFLFSRIAFESSPIMDQLPRWILPAAMSVTVTLPCYAVQYLTVRRAKAVLPRLRSLRRGTREIHRPRKFRAIEAASGPKGGASRPGDLACRAKWKTPGFFIVDYVIGKHLVMIMPSRFRRRERLSKSKFLITGKVMAAKFANPNWRKQFVGKRPRSRFALDDGIKQYQWRDAFPAGM